MGYQVTPATRLTRRTHRDGTGRAADSESDSESPHPCRSFRPVRRLAAPTGSESGQAAGRTGTVTLLPAGPGGPQGPWGPAAALRRP